MRFAKHLPLTLNGFQNKVAPLAAMFPAFRHGAATDPGRRRSCNEDHHAVVAAESLFVVCDGMGGPGAGDLAAQLATNTLASTFRGGFNVDVERQLLDAIGLANRRVYAARVGRPEMGTTIVAGVLADGWLRVAHVGNSRLYRLRDGVLEALTRDHSLLEELRDHNRGYTLEEQRRYGRRNVLTRALGIADGVEVDVRRERLRAGDRLLFCSDGVSSHLDETALRDGLAVEGPQAAASELVARANHLAASDNLTAVVVDCLRA